MFQFAAANGKVLLSGQWLLAHVQPESNDQFKCIIAESSEASALGIISHEYLLHESLVRLEQEVTVTIKKMGSTCYVCLDGKFDLSSMQWDIVEGSVAEIPGFISSKSGRVFKVNDGEGMIKLKVSIPYMPMKLVFNSKIQTPTRWSIKDNTLCREGFIFQRAMLNDNLLEYVDEAPLASLCQNFSVIMAVVNSIPFWQRSLKSKFRAAISKRLEESPGLSQTIGFYLSSQRSVSRKKKMKTGWIRTRSRVPRSYSADSNDDSSCSSLSLNDWVGGSDLCEASSYSSSHLEVPELPEDLIEDPQINFWVEFSKQDLRKGAVINVPNDLTMYDPCDPQLGELMMLKVINIMSSKAAPILVQGYVGGIDDVVSESSKFLLKSGDDLRQDVAVLQCFELMNSIWARHDVRYKGKLIQAKTYKVIPITPDTGIIEFIANCKTLQKIEDYTLLWDEEDRINMIASACGSYIAAYVLGVRDRHWDNVLVQDDGTVFHIDFGFILGKKPIPDADCLAITGSLYKMMGKHYGDFISICLASFLVLKMELEELIPFAELVFPEGKRAETFLEKRFAVHNSDNDYVLDQLKSKLQQAPRSWTTWTKNRIHEFAK